MKQDSTPASSEPSSSDFQSFLSSFVKAASNPNLKENDETVSRSVDRVVAREFTVAEETQLLDQILGLLPDLRHSGMLHAPYIVESLERCLTAFGRPVRPPASEENNLDLQQPEDSAQVLPFAAPADAGTSDHANPV